MLSLVEVRCPHCQMRGQIMVPPLGALVLGPCPQCHELLVVFCGRVLPIDKQVMMEGSDDERHAHLTEVLGTFLDERVRQLLENSPELADEIRKQLGETVGAEPQPPEDISQVEVDQFVDVELSLLDDQDYFRKVFG